jgi:hypothetical protein
MFSVNKLDYYFKIIKSKHRSLFLTRHRRTGKTTFLKDMAFIYSKGKIYNSNSLF